MSIMSKRRRTNLVISMVALEVALTAWSIAFALANDWVMLVGHIAAWIAVALWIAIVLIIRVEQVASPQANRKQE